MASEDSDELVPGFSVIHRLRDLCDRNQTLAGPVSIIGDDVHTPSEALKVVLLRGTQRMPPEERNNGLQQLLSTSNGVLAQVLPMIVMTPIDEDAADIEVPNPSVDVDSWEG